MALVEGREGGGRGRTFNSTRNNVKHFKLSCQKVESTTNGKLRQLSRRLQKITGINLETRKYGSKSGYYRHKSGVREIRFKIWRLPDYLCSAFCKIPLPCCLGCRLFRCNNNFLQDCFTLHIFYILILI